MRRFCSFLPAILFACIIPTAQIRAQEAYYQPAIEAKDIDASLGTDWFGVYLQKTKIGWCKVVFSKSDDAIVESLDLNMKLAAFDKKVEIKLKRSYTFEPKPPYRLMAGTYDQD